MKIEIVLAVLIALAFFPAAGMTDEAVVICNPSVVDVVLSKQELSDIYMGKKSMWRNQAKIVFVTLKDSPIHDRFISSYLGKSVSQFDTFWKKQVFTGKGSPPPALASEQEMIQFVSQTPGAIGYVSAGAHLNNLKKIEVR